MSAPTPVPTSPPSSAEPQLPDTKSLLLSAVPPTTATFKVLVAADPLQAAGEQKHRWYGMPIALCLIMVIAALLILVGDGAPFLDPFTSLWTSRFAYFVAEEKWVTLLVCGGWVAGAGGLCYATAWISGVQLNGWERKGSTNAIRLAGYAALASLITFALALLLVLAIGWILYLVKVRFFVLGWMLIAAFILIPFTTLGLRKIFQRTSLPGRAGLLSPLLISVMTLCVAVVTGIGIQEYMVRSMLEDGGKVNRARSTPTDAIVQLCQQDATDIVCAVTLFPGKWQDYELIGDWKLGAVDTNGALVPRYTWLPAKEEGRKYARITLEARKDITVEIRIAADRVCQAADTHMTEGDMFFAVQGRVIGVQRVVPQELRLRVGNATPGFDQIMKQACSSGA